MRDRDALSEKGGGWPICRMTTVWTPSWLSVGQIVWKWVVPASAKPFVSRPVRALRCLRLRQL